MTFRSHFLLPGLFAAAHLSGCSSDAQPEPGLTNAQRDELVRGIAEAQIVPAVEHFAQTSKQLHTAIERLCSTPDADSVDQARSAWRESAQAWYRAQIFNFGPADADPVFPLFTFIDSLRLRGTDYRDSAKTSLQRWQASEDALDDGFFAEQRFDDVGLLAVELALFSSWTEEDELPNTQQAASEFEEEPRRCQIAEGLSDELEGRARELEEGWTSSYGATEEPFLDLLTEGRLETGSPPLVQILVAAQQYVDYLHNRSVVTIAGQTSGSSWALLNAALEALSALLSSDHGGGSVLALMEDLGQQEVAEAVRRDLSDVELAIDSEDTTSLREALIVLDGDFKREIPDTLGVELGLTLTDGD